MSAHPPVIELDPVVQLESVTKAFPGVRALQGVSLSLGKGEVIGLVGKNGAGKSTLINLITGAIHPDSGSVSIAGERIRLRGPRDARGRGIAVVPQEIQLNEQLSVAENISLGGPHPRRAGTLLNRRALLERAGEVLDRLNASIDPRRKVQSLTTSERRLVMIARALWHRADVLILDEPTESLTKQEADRLHELIGEMRDSGVLVIYVSHRLRDVMDVATRVIVMRDGEVVEDRSRDQIDGGELFRLISGTAALNEPEAEHAMQEPGAELLRVLVRQEGESEDCEIRLHAGEVLGIGGLVGSGRTELLRAIYGADRDDSITVTGDSGKRIGSGPAESVEAGIGFLPEERRTEGLFEVSSITTNIAVGSLRRHRLTRRLPVVSNRRATKESKRWIAKLAIATPRADVPVQRLSGGNQQKVLFARWLSAGCRVLLLDEPTNGVDVGAKREIHDTIREFTAGGGGVILIASDFSELCGIANRVVVMRNGMIVGKLTGKDVNEDAILRLCYAVTPAA